jgi:hypothetical protein
MDSADLPSLAADCAEADGMARTKRCDRPSSYRGVMAGVGAFEV